MDYFLFLFAVVVPRTAVAFYLPDNLKRANALRLTARPEPCLLMFCQLVFSPPESRLTSPEYRYGTLSILQLPMHYQVSINQLGAVSQRARACLQISSLGSNRRQSPCLAVGLPDRLRPASLQTTKRDCFGGLYPLAARLLHLPHSGGTGQMIHPVFVCARCLSVRAALLDWP